MRLLASAVALCALGFGEAHAQQAGKLFFEGDLIIMQATGEPGWHYIDLYPAIYKGKETRPNNYWLPQLTFADDHPGEDLPRFRFAF